MVYECGHGLGEGVKTILAMPGFWNMRTLSIVASRIYAKSTSVPGLGGGGGRIGNARILAAPHIATPPLAI